jgi:hypothetical protein
MIIEVEPNQSAQLEMDMTASIRRSIDAGVDEANSTSTRRTILRSRGPNAMPQTLEGKMGSTSCREMVAAVCSLDATHDPPRKAAILSGARHYYKRIRPQITTRVLHAK